MGKVVAFHPIQNILVVQEWNISGYGGQFGLAFITFLYVDILDCTGTLYSMARFCGAIDERTQDFEGSAVAYLVDAFGITIGSLFGSPPVTAYIESGAGISEGGATGLTAIATGLCFFISIFFAPIFASIPPWATGCTLIIVGSMMAKQAAQINWTYMGDALPIQHCGWPYRWYLLLYSHQHHRLDHREAVRRPHQACRQRAQGSLDLQDRGWTAPPVGRPCCSRQERLL